MTDKIARTALVTGASRGIGRGIALLLGELGYTVMGTATSQTGADGISKALEEAGVRGKGYVLDQSQQESVEALFAQMADEFGNPNILVNNAGLTRDNLFLRMKEDEWSNVLNTNLSGIYRLVKAAIKPMVKARWGRIINLTSVVGFTGNPGQTNYSAAKAGLVAFSKSLALEIASRGITVNCIAPGFIDTDMTRAINDDHKETLLKNIPMQRMGTVNDIAQGVAFLASDAASYITGETIHINGGLFMN